MAVVIFVRKFGEKNITFISGSLVATDMIQFIIKVLSFYLKLLLATSMSSIEDMQNETKFFLVLYCQ